MAPKVAPSGSEEEGGSEPERTQSTSSPAASAEETRAAQETANAHAESPSVNAEPQAAPSGPAAAASDAPISAASAELDWNESTEATTVYQPKRTSSRAGAGTGQSKRSSRGIPRAPSSQRNLPVAVGDVIAGKYVVEKIIGAGGVGVVVSARHEGLGDRVAIKFLQRSAAETRENVARFDLEARALARVKTEHVARVMDVGRLPTGEPFMVMELLEGEDLSKVIARGRVPVAEAVDHVVQACEAVAAAHAVSIVHRDLKPANLFVTQTSDGRQLIKVLDFGISKLRNETHAVTQTLSVVGSPLYMSPEQMEAPRDADERADIWSLGVILFELIAAAPPFDAPNLPLLCARICTSPPRSFASLGVEVPEQLERLIVRCLEKKPEDRVASVVALALDLAPFGGRAAAESAERLSRALHREEAVPPSARKFGWQVSGVRNVPPALVDAASQPRAKAIRFTTATFAVLMLAFFGGGVVVTQWPGREANRTEHAREFLGLFLLRARLQLAPEPAQAPVPTAAPQVLTAAPSAPPSAEPVATAVKSSKPVTSGRSKKPRPASSVDILSER
jgi:serine/threonine-protein kinase